MKFLPKSLMVLFLALYCGCGSNLNDPSSTTSPAPVDSQQVTVNINGTSLARTSDRFTSSVRAFRARLFNAQGAQLATVTVPRDTSQDSQTVTLPVSALLNLTLTVEALDDNGNTLLSLVRRVGGSGSVSISDADFSPGLLPAPYVTDSNPCPAASTMTPYRGLASLVTIKGQYLQGVTYVQFGGTQAPVSASSQDGTWLQVVAPVQPVGITAPILLIMTLTGPPLACPIVTPTRLFYYYTDAPQPEVEGLDPNTGPQGGGTLVTLTGHGFTGASAVTFGGTWTNITSFISDSQITVTTPAVPKPGPLPVTVQYKNATGLPEEFGPANQAFTFQ